MGRGKKGFSSTAERGRCPQRSEGRRGCSASALPVELLRLPSSFFSGATAPTPSDLRACFAVSTATSPAFAVEDFLLGS